MVAPRIGVARGAGSPMKAAHPRVCRAYVASVVALGTMPLAFAVAAAFQQPIHPGWLILAVLSLLSGPLAIRIPSIEATISVSEGFIIAAGLLFGPAAATLTAALDGLGVSLWNRHRSLRRTLFNVAEPAISVTIAMWVFYSLAGISPLLYRTAAFQPLIAPLLAMTVVYFGLNTMLNAMAVWLESGMSPAVLIRKHLSHLALDFCVSLSLGAVIVQTSANVTVAAVVVLVPMLLASYLSSHYVAGQLEETDRHLAELRRLYDSTVETLAMAVDAKDQITAGHIRRVQLLSTRLARAVGASPEQVRALEAAALLHDLGKLAVPEHILKKPGALTPAEYEQMKAHAAIGASILSRIEFPFPVVPIVRHHHENWDGTGYPDGLRGEEIPLGARILSVVDCYDALISDRPYRLGMCPEDAIEIIRRRVDTMYDRSIVDAFIRVHAQMPPEERTQKDDGPSLLALRMRPDIERPAATGSARASLKAKRQSVYDFAARLKGASPRQIATSVAGFFADGSGNGATAIYRFDVPADQLVLLDASESLMGLIPGVRNLGDGVTGWVGSARSVLANSDAALDLDIASDPHAVLRMCVAAPLLHKGELVGVLTVYSSCAFNEPERLIIEVMAEELAPLLARALAGDNDAPAPHVASGHWRAAVGQ
ncbi:MAG: HD domain-containing phosphohydrolase [Acidobacteriota bacterium]